MSVAISVRNLQKRYHFARRPRGLRARLASLGSSSTETIEAVAGISFEIGKAERVAIIGPNGAGKSTTLKMLSGILEPSAEKPKSSVLCHGGSAKCSPTGSALSSGSARNCGPSFRRAIPFHYCAESTTWTRSISHADWPGSSIGSGSRHFDQPVQRLSLGQRMRCEIVASLLHAPDLLFLDEPTIGLDITAKAAIRDFIREQAESEGLTVVLTSHDTRDIELVCERVIVINEGRIVVDQPTDQLRRQFLARKLVTLQSVAPAITLAIEGVTRRPSEAHTSVFDVDTRVARVDAVIEAALAQGGIEDITIEDPPMEEVVREIYANAAR